MNNIQYSCWEVEVYNCVGDFNAFTFVTSLCCGFFWYNNKSFIQKKNLDIINTVDLAACRTENTLTHSKDNDWQNKNFFGRTLWFSRIKKYALTLVILSTLFIATFHCLFYFILNNDNYLCIGYCNKKKSVRSNS